MTKPQSFWKNVLWSDETKVKLSGKGQNGTVYRKGNRAFKETTVNIGGSNMFFGCFDCVNNIVKTDNFEARFNQSAGLL